LARQISTAGLLTRHSLLANITAGQVKSTNMAIDPSHSGKAPGMKHRLDIDGLRAIAVGAVVLLHAGAPGFAGGFVGVDVFFVISGYLITKMLVDEMATGRFSIANFYERRARRILPALFALLLFTSVAAYKLLLPDATREYALSLIATLFFSSNMFFLKHPGAFGVADSMKPLLHTWSLAVEEQFYIFYPIFLLLVSRYLRKRYAAAIGVALFFSFVWSAWAVRGHPEAAFYVAAGRAWELLVGGLLAVELIPKPKSGMATQALGLLGMALILYGVFAFSGKTAFPGPNALYPCVGAALIMYVGQCGTPIVTRILSAPPMVFIGLISYSLYLWHWVLFVFARYYSIRPLTGWETTATIAASVVAATLSWKFVENPFRGRRAIGTRSWIFAAAAVCTVLFGVYGALAVRSGGFPSRFSHTVLAALRGANDTWPRSAECMAKPCRIGAPQAGESFVLWGDSEAEAIAPMVDREAQANHLAGLAAVRLGCPPLLGVRLGGGCANFNNAVLGRLQESHIRNVMLHARWSLFAEGQRYQFEPGKPLPLAPGGKWQDNYAEFDRLVHATLQELRSRDLNVVIVASVPEVGLEAPSSLARVAEFGLPMEVAPRYGEFTQRQARTFQTLKRWADEYSMKIVYPHEILCDSSTCSVAKDGWDLYSDGSHLTLHGAMVLAPLFPKISEDWRVQSH
jgi:peptidoglycan/LPS O-acetylase OafA/YrhL